MKTLEELKQLITQHNKPEAAQKPGMVYQVWEDGEITLQKSGELLWKRTLHLIARGLNRALPLYLFPNRYNDHAYLFVESKEIAELIREGIRDYFNSNPIEEK